MATLRQVAVDFCIGCVVGISLLMAAINLWLEKRILEQRQDASHEILPMRRLVAEELRITVIIATKNESRTIGKTMRNFESTTVDKSRVEIIIVDVGSMDRTIEVAKASSGSIPVTYINKVDVGGGRGLAINAGYEKSSGDILLILRADSLVPPRYDETIRLEFSKSNLLFAAFKFAVDKRASFNQGLWVLAHYFNLRSSLFWFPSAIQGLALTSQAFEIHKFPDHVIMDDVAFYLNIRNTCLSYDLEFKLLNQPITSSSSRWENIGVLTWITLDSLAHYAYINLHMQPERVFYLCYDLLPHLIKNFFRRNK
jgi:glycosyltransferase involved in cell wall biosynthesis